MDEVSRAIATAVIHPGDAVPSLRQLAGELRINPLTIKQAYDQLEREGVLSMRQGFGTFVAEQASRAEARDYVARGVAERALRDAHRHGLDVRALIAAIRDADQAKSPAKMRRSGRGDAARARCPDLHTRAG